MSSSRVKFEPVWCARVSVIALCALAAPVLGGCASSRQPSYAEANARVAVPAPIPKVELEDDGLPVQSPPPKRAAPEAEDPTEPYSRNYGSTRPVRKASVRTEAAPKVTVGHDSTFDEDGIIAAAIAQHEARVR